MKEEKYEDILIELEEAEKLESSESIESEAGFTIALGGILSLICC